MGGKIKKELEFRSEHVTEKPINNLTVEGKNNDLSRVSRVNRITNLLKDFGAETLKTISTLSLEQAIGIFGAGELGKELGLLSSPSLDAEIIMTLLTMAKISSCLSTLNSFTIFNTTILSGFSLIILPNKFLVS